MKKKISIYMMVVFVLSLILGACNTPGEQTATEPVAATPIPTFAPEAMPTAMDTESLKLQIGFGERGSWYEVYFTDPSHPNAASQTGGLDVVIVQAIDAAKQTIDLAIYNLTLPSIGDALIRAHQRGVVVRVVMETENITDNEVVANMQAAGIPIRNDEHSGQDTGLMHDKFMVIDRAEVWTGSMNYTATGVYSDNNNLMHVYSDKIAENYTTEFNEMFVNGLFSYETRSDTPYPELFMPDGFRVENLFSPDDGVSSAIAQAMGGAQTSIYFMGYSFTSLDLMKIISEKDKEGLKISGVLDQSQMSITGTEKILQLIYSMNLDVRMDGIEGLMHHKVIIIDERIVVLGSYNFTKSAEERNDENVLIISDPSLALLFMDEFQRIYSKSQPIKAP